MLTWELHGGSGRMAWLKKWELIVTKSARSAGILRKRDPAVTNVLRQLEMIFLDRLRRESSDSGDDRDSSSAFLLGVTIQPFGRQTRSWLDVLGRIFQGENVKFRNG